MAKKKKNKKKKKTGTKKKIFSFLPLSDKAKRRLWGGGLTLVVIHLVLSFFGRGGKMGELLLRFLSFFIGKTVFLLPLVLVLGALSFFFAKYKKIYMAVGLSCLAFVVSISGVLEVFSQKGWLQGDQFVAGEEKIGGWIGHLFSWPFLKLFGFWLTLIIWGLLLSGSCFVFWRLLRRPSSEEEEPKEKKPSLVKKIFSPSFKVKEVESFPETPEKKKKQEPEKSPAVAAKKSSREEEESSWKKDYEAPPLDLLKKPQGKASGGNIKENSTIIKKTLQSFDIPVEMSGVKVGPTVTQYSLKPAEGIKLSKITSLSDDLALALANHPIRIEAPIPGKSLVGIEVPNKVRSFVSLREMIEHENFQKNSRDLLFCLGNNVAGNPSYADLEKMPHLLVAGATGSGKTIFLNSLILSLIFRNSPEMLKLLVVDPKRVEFTVYRKLPHLLCPPVVESERAVNGFKWLIDEMEKRFRMLEEARSRNINSYNRKAASGELPEPLPYIVLVVDELADLMSDKGKEVESSIVRLAQMSRAVGIHLVLATQRPSVEVITGLIKANITSRVTFQVASQVDSRTIIDSAGAEKLLGSGDMLFLSGETVKPQRIQSPYVSEQEVQKVIKWIADSQEDREKMTGEVKLEERLQEALEEEETASGVEGEFAEEDPLYPEAKEIVVEYQRGSASLLQRKLSVGYARAARLIDMLEEEGVVGPHRGPRARKVFMSQEEIQEDDLDEKEEENWEQV